MNFKEKKKFNKLADKKLKKTPELGKEVNRDDLVNRYKGRSSDEKFDKYDNALDIINKIQNGEIRLSDAKNDQTKFNLHLSEIKKKVVKNQKSKKTHYTILKCFTKQGKRLLNFLMIILQWYLWQKIKQPKEQDLKY